MISPPQLLSRGCARQRRSCSSSGISGRLVLTGCRRRPSQGSVTCNCGIPWLPNLKLELEVPLRLGNIRLRLGRAGVWCQGLKPRTVYVLHLVHYSPLAVFGSGGPRPLDKYYVGSGRTSRGMSPHDYHAELSPDRPIRDVEALMGRPWYQAPAATRPKPVARDSPAIRPSL